MIRRKAMADPNFPSKEIFDEFMNKKLTITKLDSSWNQPKIVKFIVSYKINKLKSNVN